jgi:hypothetical protein
MLNLGASCEDDTRVVKVQRLPQIVSPGKHKDFEYRQLVEKIAEFKLGSQFS